MSLADQIKAIYLDRDEAMRKATAARMNAHAALEKEWAAFHAEQTKALEAKAVELQGRHAAAENDELNAINEAVNDADVKVAKLADDTMAETLGNDDTPTAAEIARTWKIADLKAIAKTRGLPVSGKEVEVAQRLLDNGWAP